MAILFSERKFIQFKINKALIMGHIDLQCVYFYMCGQAVPLCRILFLQIILMRQFQGTCEALLLVL